MDGPVQCKPDAESQNALHAYQQHASYATLWHEGGPVHDAFLANACQPLLVGLLSWTTSTSEKHPLDEPESSPHATVPRGTGQLQVSTIRDGPQTHEVLSGHPTTERTVPDATDAELNACQPATNVLIDAHPESDADHVAEPYETHATVGHGRRFTDQVPDR